MHIHLQELTASVVRAATSESQLLRIDRSSSSVYNLYTATRAVGEADEETRMERASGVASTRRYTGRTQTARRAPMEPTSRKRTTSIDMMLAGTQTWTTTLIPTAKTETVILGVDDGSHVTSLEVATSDAYSEVQVQEVNADGIVGVTLVSWQKCGGKTFGDPSPKTFTFTVAPTFATMFLFTVRHTDTTDDGMWTAGLAIARFHGFTRSPK